MHRHPALILGLAFSLAGCGFSAPPPARTPARAMPQPPLSSIAATLTIPAGEIAGLLNRQTQDHIADLHDQPVKCGIGRCRLNLLAQREGAITIGGSGDVLELHLPFHVDADISAPGFLSMLRAKANARGEADARTAFVIGPDWRLRSSTHGEVQLENSHLRIGPLVTNLADVWNANQDMLSAPLWRAMDRQISGLRLKPKIAATWARLFTPIQIGRKPPAWLVLRPESLRVAQPQISNGNVILSLMVDVRAYVMAADLPPPNATMPLPAPTRLGAPSDRFSVAVPVQLSYDQAARLAMASLARKPLRIAGALVHFTDLKILPSGQDVVLAARFCVEPGWDFLGWFSSCGSGYLRGAPRFDAATGIIRITNVHYDIATAGLVLRTMRMLAGVALGRALQTHLVFDESRQIARLDRQVSETLAKPQGGTIAIAADISVFGAPQFTWTDTGFLAVFSAAGKVRTSMRL